MTPNVRHSKLHMTCTLENDDASSQMDEKELPEIRDLKEQTIEEFLIENF